MTPEPPLAESPSCHPVQARNPDIAHLVETFYAAARQDALLGPVFAAAIADWPHHLAALTAFWAAQLRGRGAYRGQPIAAHRALAARASPALTPPMFARWLELWGVTCRACMAPADADALIERAARIAAALQGAIWPGEPA